MSGKKDKPIDLSKEELGLLDQVLQNGWKSLSSKETGRIGGLITKKRREASNNHRNVN